jgi:hypothetical protein
MRRPRFKLLDRPATGRWLQHSGAIDEYDLTLTGPIVRATHQTRAYGIFINVIPFLLVALVAAQHVIEKTFLPDLAGWSRKFERLGECLFQCSDPASENEICIAAHEQMHVIGHDHITTDSDVKIALGALTESNESRMNCVARQTWLSLMRAKGHEVKWAVRKNPIESRRP